MKYTYILIIFSFFSNYTFSQQITFNPIPTSSQLIDAKELKKRAKKESSKDKVIYADALFSGKYGVKINKKEALEYYNKAYLQDNNPIAAWRLAYLSNQDGNKEETLKWLKNAADRKHPLAKYEYGKLLYDGKNITLNWAESVKYLDAPDPLVKKKSYNLLGQIYSQKEAIKYGLTPTLEKAKSYFQKSGSNEELDKLLNQITSFENAKNKNTEISNFIPLDFGVNLEEIDAVINFLNSAENANIPNQLKKSYKEYVRLQFLEKHLASHSDSYLSMTKHINLILARKELNISDKELMDAHEVIKANFLNEDITAIKKYHSYLDELKEKYNPEKINELQDELQDDFITSKVKEANSTESIKRNVSTLQDNKNWLGESTNSGILKLAEKLENHIDLNNPNDIKNHLDYIKKVTGEDYTAKFASKFITTKLDKSRSKADLQQISKDVNSNTWLKPHFSSFAKSFESKHLKLYDFNNSSEIRSYFADLKLRETSYNNKIKSEIAPIIKEQILKQCKDQNSLTTLKQKVQSKGWLFETTLPIDAKLVAYEAEPYLKIIGNTVESKNKRSNIIHEFSLVDCELQIRVGMAQYQGGRHYYTLHLPLGVINPKSLGETNIPKDSRGTYQIFPVATKEATKKREGFYQTTKKTKDKKVPSSLPNMPHYFSKQDALKAVNAIKELMIKCGG